MIPTLLPPFNVLDTQDAKPNQGVYLAGRQVNQKPERELKKHGISEEEALKGISVFSDVMDKMIPKEPEPQPAPQPPPSATPPYGESSFMLTRLAMQNPNRQEKEKANKREGAKQGKDKGREE